MDRLFNMMAKPSPDKTFFDGNIYVPDDFEIIELA